MLAKYNYEVGKLYDTIFYIVVRLFEDEMIGRVYTKFAKSENLEYDMRFYTELKSKCPDISSELIPFCYCNSQQISFLIHYVGDNINFDNGTINDLKELFLDTKRSKKCFVDLYFPKLTESDRQKLCETNDIKFINSIIIKSDIAEKYHSTFLVFLAAFDTYISSLVQTIETIYLYVDRLHKQNAEVIQGIVNQLENHNNVERILKYFALKEDKQLVFMFLLLNPYGVNYWNEPHKYPFILGEKFLITLSLEIDYNHITFESFAKMLLSPARSEIFRMFLEYKHLKAGDIIEATKLSRYTVYAHLNDMLFEKILIYVDTGGATLHYTLNEEYLLRYIEYITRETNYYINLKREDGLKYYVRPRKKRKDAKG